MRVHVCVSLTIRSLDFISPLHIHGMTGEDHNGIADVPDNIRLRATNFFNLRATTRVEVSLHHYTYMLLYKAC